MRGRGAALIGLVLIAAACRPARPPPPPPPTVIVYGDSLTNGSKAFIEAGIAKRRPGWRVVIRSFGGTAICDWLAQMQKDGGLNARVVIVQFSGNALTPCMAASTPAGSPGYLAKYTTDANAAAAIWTARGVKVGFVASPGPFLEPPPLFPAPHVLDGVYSSVAAARAASGVTFSNAPEMALAVADPSVPGQFVFPLRMPCLPHELTLPGCVMDLTDNTLKIQVRDGLPPDAGNPTSRGHFCPIAHASPCPVYASGAFRFGDAIAATASTLMV
ncbi:MAG: SGNH/GDSL hydrolase family protein [Acidimicrobiia bacterium]